MQTEAKALATASWGNTTGQPNLGSGRKIKKMIEGRRVTAGLIDDIGSEQLLAAIVRENLVSDLEESDQSRDWDVLDVTGGIPANRNAINSTELWKAIRKLSNPNVKLVIKVLRKKNSLIFKDLAEETKLSVNSLNHALYDLKQLNLVIQLEDKMYYLTKYCVALLGALKFLKEMLNGLDSDEVISPFDITKK